MSKRTPNAPGQPHPKPQSPPTTAGVAYLSLLSVAVGTRLKRDIGDTNQAPLDDCHWGGQLSPEGLQTTPILHAARGQALLTVTEREPSQDGHEPD